MELRTDAEREAIQDVFIFSEDQCELVIERIEASAESDGGC